MLRIGPILLSISVLALIAGTPSSAQAQTASIPSYFFNQWSVQSNCTEQGADPAGHTQVGLQFLVSPSSVSADGTSYSLETINSDTQTWPDGWSNVSLAYRAGTPMTAIPADFACVPGEAASSSLLAMSNYAQSAEPYYENEHWYGYTTINGEPHHVLIFPRNINGTDGVVIVLLDAATQDTVQLDHSGTIHGDTD